MKSHQEGDQWTDGWMDNLGFYIRFNSILFIYQDDGAGDNERLFATEPCLERENLLQIFGYAERETESERASYANSWL